MADLPSDANFADYLAAKLEDWGYSSGVSQKLFGDMPTLDEFINSTDGDVSISVVWAPRSSLTYSRYPIETLVVYTSKAKEENKPVFGRKLRHMETIKLFTYKEFQNLDRDALKEDLETIRNHRKTRIETSYGRNAVVKFRPD